MDVAKPFEIIVENPMHRLLIATQGSDFKDAVVAGVVEALKERPISIKSIDVSGLSTVDVSDWDALVILHTWESSKQQEDVRLFLEHQTDLGKVIVLSTSGSGNLTMDGIDAISSASRMSAVHKHVISIVQRIDHVIGNQRK